MNTPDDAPHLGRIELDYLGAPAPAIVVARIGPDRAGRYLLIGGGPITIELVLDDVATAELRRLLTD